MKRTHRNVEFGGAVVAVGIAVALTARGKTPDRQAIAAILEAVFNEIKDLLGSSPLNYGGLRFCHGPLS
jgi:hypothetical protein